MPPQGQWHHRLHHAPMPKKAFSWIGIKGRKALKRNKVMLGFRLLEHLAAGAM